MKVCTNVDRHKCECECLDPNSEAGDVLTLFDIYIKFLVHYHTCLDYSIMEKAYFFVIYSFNISYNPT